MVKELSSLPKSSIATSFLQTHRRGKLLFLWTQNKAFVASFSFCNDNKFSFCMVSSFTKRFYWLFKVYISFINFYFQFLLLYNRPNIWSRRWFIKTIFTHLVIINWRTILYNFSYFYVFYIQVFKKIYFFSFTFYLCY